MTIYTDGFSNNKESGYTVTDERGELIHREVFPHRRTCNEAELKGLYFAVGVAGEGEEIRTDSKVALAWAKNGRAAARPDLSAVCDAIKSIARSKRLTLRWVRRENNLAGVWNEEHGKW